MRATLARTTLVAVGLIFLVGCRGGGSTRLASRWWPWSGGGAGETQLAGSSTGMPQLPADMAQVPPTATPGFPTTSAPPAIAQTEMAYPGGAPGAMTDPSMATPPPYAATGAPNDPTAAAGQYSMAPQQGYYPVDPAAGGVPAGYPTAPPYATAPGEAMPADVAAGGYPAAYPTAEYPQAPYPQTPNAMAPGYPAAQVPQGQYPVATAAGADTGGAAVYQADARSALPPGQPSWPPQTSDVGAVTPGQYEPGATGYVPGATGYTPPAYQTAPVYEALATAGAVPTATPATTSPPRTYRPGSTGDYVPGATRLNAVPADSGVAPVVYEGAGSGTVTQ